MPARLVTLSTDFGPVYAAQVKAVLTHYLPPERIVELVDDLPAHQVREAAFLVRQMARGFPAGSVHLVVVDPGVGSGRAALAIRCKEGSVLVGPDNGVLFPLADELGISECVRLDPARVRSGPSVGATFEGRDLFAPVAGRIARGTPLRRLGRPANATRLALAVGRHRPGGAEGEVLHTDRFGDLVTSIPSGFGPPVGTVVHVAISRGRTARARAVRTYSDLAPGELGVLPSSFGLLELSLRESRASDRLKLLTGDQLDLTWTTRRGTGARPDTLATAPPRAPLPRTSGRVDVRPFEPADHRGVIGIWRAAGLELGPSDTWPEIARALQRDPDLFLVAVRRGRLVGAVLGRFDGRRGWVNHLAVRPEEQARGTGRRLLRRLEGALRRRGCRKVNLHVVPSNLAALEFYSKLGYRQRELVMMERWLSSPGGRRADPPRIGVRTLSARARPTVPRREARLRSAPKVTRRR